LPQNLIIMEYWLAGSIDILPILKPIAHTFLLTDTRGVGRKQIPSTVLGLLFHSAEHTMRHTGQLLVTCKILTQH
jgi:hypothetical protein